MGRAKVDFSDVQDFDLLPAGIYEGSIEQITWRGARSEDKFDQLSVQLLVTGGDHDGRKCWQNLSFSPKAKWRMAKFFNLFELDADDVDIEWDDDEPHYLLEPDLTGEPVTFKVKHRKWNGDDTLDVEVIEWNGRRGKGKKRPADDEAPARKSSKPAEDDDDEDDEEEKPARRSSSNSSSGTTKRRTLR